MTDSTAAEKATSSTPRRGVARFAPIAFIALLAAAVFVSGLWRYLSLDTLGQHRAAIEAFVTERFLLSLLLYVLAYVVITASSLPVATLMSLVGGFLFGPLVGTAAILVAATLGAGIVFTAAKTAIGDALRRRAGPFLRKMEQGFQENAFSYLLLLRLIPVFPFFVVNVAPALLNIPTRTFIVATFIGIIPGAFAYAAAGNGLGAVLDAGGELRVEGLLTDPAILIAIAALAVVALLPVVLKAFGVVPKKRDAA